MKTVFTLFINVICLLNFFITTAQPYYNEWIDFEQDYYKIKVGENGMYRIDYALLQQTDLPLVGSGFQLYSQGKQVPIYVSNEHEFTPTDFIEFYGEMNDGSFDTQLYQQTDDQLNPFRSLFTDTATYYLTWSNTQTPLHYQSVANDLNDLPPKTNSFSAQKRADFIQVFNTGKYDFKMPYYSERTIIVDSININKSSFGENEGYLSSLVVDSRHYSFPTPYVDRINQQKARLQVKLAGRNDIHNILLDHRVQVHVQDQLYIDTVFADYTSLISQASIALSDLDSSQTTITFSDLDSLNSHFSIAYIEHSYPRLFQFDGEQQLDIVIENEEEKYIELDGFDGGTQPLIWDQTNLIRLMGTVEDSMTKIKLPVPTTPAEKRQLFIAHPDVIKPVEGLEEAHFIDFTQMHTQGNYLIISHPQLMAGDTNWVAQYAQYRASTAGSSYQTTIVNIEDLYDQFSYGIAKHPLAIRHFINFAIDHWTIAPEYLLLLGKSVSYRIGRLDHESYNQCLVPTYGFPESDQYLVSRNDVDTRPQLAVGRISASTPQDITHYLDKIKTHESSFDNPCDLANQQWRRHILPFHSSNNFTEEISFTAFFQEEKELFANSFFGGITPHIYSAYLGTDIDEIVYEQVDEGVGIVLYLGNTNFFENTLPDSLNNKNKYPFFIQNASFIGASHSPFGNEDEASPVALTLAKDAGAIGFIGRGAWCFDSISHDHMKAFIPNLMNTYYEQPIGYALQQTFYDLYVEQPQTFHEKMMVYMLHDFNLVGDPALRLWMGEEVDYAVSDMAFDIENMGFTEDSIPILVDHTPSFDVTATLTNLGKNEMDTVTVELWVTPNDASPRLIASQKELLTTPATVTFTVDSAEYDVAGRYDWSIRISSPTTESCLTNNEQALPLIRQQDCTALSIPFDGDTLIYDGSEAVLLDAGEDWHTYQWSTGDTTSSILVTETDRYTLYVTTMDGCSLYAAVRVHDCSALFSVASTDTLYLTEGWHVSLEYEEPLTERWRYSWNDIQESSRFRVIEAGTYAVTITSNLGCSIIKNIVVAPCTGIPLIPFDGDTLWYTGIPLILDAGEHWATYQWLAQDTTGQYHGFPGEEHLTVAHFPGQYSITVTDDKGCYQFGEVTVLDVVSSTSALFSHPSIQFFPNPTTHQLHLNHIPVAKSTSLSWQLYNIHGQLVKQQQQAFTRPNLTINLADLPKGIYLFQLTIDGKRFTHKIIKQ